MYKILNSTGYKHRPHKPKNQTTEPSSKEKDALASELNKIVEKYFINRGSGIPTPFVSFNTNNLLKYEFKYGNRIMNSITDFYLSCDKYSVQAYLINFKKDVCSYLESKGFKKVKFNIKSNKLLGIYFDIS